MPGFGEAFELAREQKLLRHLCIHLILPDGFPLTEQIKRQPRFCDEEGKLALASTDHPILVLNRSGQDALAGEIRARIRRCRNAGIPLTHLDSHYHLHNHLAVLNVLIPAVRSAGIRYVRTARNCRANIPFAKACYKRAINFRLASAGLHRTKLFGSIDDLLFLKRNLGRASGESFEVPQKSSEAMVHPVFDERGVLADSAGGPPLLTRVQAVHSYQDAVSFNEKQLRPSVQDSGSRPDEAMSACQQADTKLQPSEI
jgi:predicted glycoside hydrolase/deacetylase ChbG (UPF0249 family)